MVKLYNIPVPMQNRVIPALPHNLKHAAPSQRIHKNLPVRINKNPYKSCNNEYLKIKQITLYSIIRYFDEIIYPRTYITY